MRLRLIVGVLALALFLGLLLATARASVTHPRTSESLLAHHSHVRWVNERHHAAKLRTARTLRRRDVLVDLAAPVAVCEEGGFGHYGFPAFPNSIGMDAANWARFGFGHDLRPFVQALALERFIDFFGIGWPDRGVCAAY